MKWYPWLTEPYRTLVEQYQGGQGHHALLLHAEVGMGAEELVIALSYWLLCQHPSAEKICRKCHGCRLMQAGNHPDWYRIVAEQGKNQLGIDLIRQLIESLYTHAHQGGAKVIWLPEAGSLSEAAANALLKTLEEPPANTFFILGCSQPQQLLSTIRSRCQYYHLTCPDEAYSIGWLQQQETATTAASCAALRLTAGAPLAAMRLLSEPCAQQRKNLCSALQQALDNQDLLLLLPQLKQDNTVECLHWLYTLLLDSGKWQLGAEHAIANQDHTPLVQQLARSGKLEIWQRIARDCWLCRHQLLTVAGLNVELILTERLCRWQEWLCY